MSSAEPSAVIEETLSRIESRLAATQHLTDRERDELTVLLHDLKQDLGLAADQPDHAESVGSVLRSTESAAHAALRPEQDPELMKLALQELEESTQRFEADHPRLVSVLRAIGKSLADIGI